MRRNQTHHRCGFHTQSQCHYNSGQEQSFQYQDFSQGQPPRQRMNRNQNSQYRNPNQGQGQIKGSVCNLKIKIKHSAIM